MRCREWPGLVAREIGIPIRYRSAHKRDFAADWPADIAKWVAMGDGVFLSGSTGIGKTHFAAALVVETMEGFIPRENRRAVPDVRWSRCPDILAHIRSTYGDAGKKGGETERDVIDGYRRAGLLVIDDLGAEKVTDWSVSALYAILAGRVDDMRPTIITSNLGLADIHKWEPRIASRLAAFFAVRLPKVDRRVAK